MIAGFVIWTLVSLFLFGIGIRTWTSRGAAGFFTGVKPPEVTDVRKYNRAVALLWFAYVALFWLLGLPLLFMRQNSPVFLLSILGTAVISIALTVVYNRILEKYRVRKEKK